MDDLWLQQVFGVVLLAAFFGGDALLGSLLQHRLVDYGLLVLLLKVVLRLEVLLLLVLEIGAVVDFLVLLVVGVGKGVGVEGVELVPVLKRVVPE